MKTTTKTTFARTNLFLVEHVSILRWGWNLLFCLALVKYCIHFLLSVQSHLNELKEYRPEVLTPGKKWVLSASEEQRPRDEFLPVRSRARFINEKVLLHDCKYFEKIRWWRTAIHLILCEIRLTCYLLTSDVNLEEIESCTCKLIILQN